MKRLRIGVFCGAFDPAHLGHLSVARQALQAGVDQVIFLPGARLSTHKAVASGTARAQMIRLMIKNEPNMTLSTIDHEDTRPKLLSETMKELKKEHQGAELALILGSDRLSLLLCQSDARKVFSLCSVMVVQRGGTPSREVIEDLCALGAKVTVLDQCEKPIYAQEIRQQISAFDEPDGVTMPVAQYIAANGLYHDESLMTVSRRMNEKRFRHTLGVRQDAVRLAALHGIPLQKAAQAAMLHDCAKGLPFDQMLALAEEAGIRDENVLSSPAMLHGPVGAYIAEKEYHVTDPDVLRAIIYHTVGRENMSPLELCIFVADAEEPNRDNYPGLKRIRRLSQENLPAAALLSLNLTREYILSRGKMLNPLSDATVAWLQTRVPRELLYLTQAGTR